VADPFEPPKSSVDPVTEAQPHAAPPSRILAVLVGAAVAFVTWLMLAVVSTLIVRPHRLDSRNWPWDSPKMIAMVAVEVAITNILGGYIGAMMSGPRSHGNAILQGLAFCALLLLIVAQSRDPWIPPIAFLIPVPAALAGALMWRRR
jgi:hypothetical protein